MSDEDAPSEAAGAAPSIPPDALSREMPIINKRGLHARASAKFVQTVERFNAEVWVTRGSETVGVDGETFHFSGGGIAGQAWSPSDTEPPGMLVDLALAMIAYCRHKDARTLAAIEQSAAILEQRLNESP